MMKRLLLALGALWFAVTGLAASAGAEAITEVMARWNKEINPAFEGLVQKDEAVFVTGWRAERDRWLALVDNASVGESAEADSKSIAAARIT